MEKLFEPGSLSLFLIFFVPGFVALKVYDLLVASERRDFSKSAFDAVAFSALNFAVLWPLVRLVLSNGFQAAHPTLAIAFVFLILLIMPAIWPVIWVKVLMRMRTVSMHLVHPHDKAWDFVFSKRESFWIVLHMKDMRRIGGRFGEKSFASSNPAEAQIYLEEVWRLDEEGRFEEAVNLTNGILVLEKDLLAVEFFRYYEEEEQ